MPPLDFLKRQASTPLRRRYLAAGAVFEISTNSESILTAAQESFSELVDPDLAPHTTLGKTPDTAPSTTIDCRLRFWVDSAATSAPPWPKPYFRGLDHLVFAGFDPQNSLLVDLRSRRVSGRFSPDMESDRSYWKTVIFPVLLTMAGATLGITELHCACVERDGQGLLLAGASGSGKSTLTLALARNGFAFLSDDRTYLSRRDGELVAWGLPTRLKLRPEAAVFFPDLCGPDLDGSETPPLQRNGEQRIALNGERAFEIDLEGDLGLARAPRCDPRRLIFLERQEEPGFSLTAMPLAEAAARLASDLLPETPEAAAIQRQTIDELVRRPAHRLRYGGDPQQVAGALIQWCGASGCSGGVSPPSGPRDSVSPPSGCSGGVSPPSDETTKLRSATRVTSIGAPRVDAAPNNLDPLRRFLPTPLVADLPVMGRTIRLETNSPRVLDQARGLLQPYAGQPSVEPVFRWRIVSQADPAVTLPWPEVSAFSDDGLRYVTFGHRSFAAVDLDARQAVAFLAESLASDEPGFSTPFLERLFLLTAGALGLTPVAAACVAIEDRALLVFGPPMSGKTTSCYLSTRRGLDFHADQATFLELTESGVAAWGEFWPTAFRLDALRLFPELESITRPFQYGEFKFRYLDKNGASSHGARRLTPVCCVFLEKAGEDSPRLVELRPQEFASRRDACLLFQDDARFEVTQSAVLRALSRLPAYHLPYPSDPADAAAFFPALLEPQALEAAT